MLYFWLAMGIVSAVAVTYFGLQEGFALWYHYYAFSAIAFLMYFLRQMMMKRMVKHEKFLEDQRNQQKN